jgi:hypothetical protein
MDHQTRYGHGAEMNIVDEFELRYGDAEILAELQYAPRVRFDVGIAHQHAINVRFLQPAIPKGFTRRLRAKLYVAPAGDDAHI